MLQTIIDGHVQDRATVLAWEGRRMSVVRRKLKLSPSKSRVDEHRRELTQRKLALGHDGIRALLGRCPRIADKISWFSVAISGKTRRFSIFEIAVTEGSTERFAKWFDDLAIVNNEREMIVSCRDRYIIARDAQGRHLSWKRLTVLRCRPSSRSIIWTSPACTSSPIRPIPSSCRRGATW